VQSETFYSNKTYSRILHVNNPSAVEFPCYHPAALGDTSLFNGLYPGAREPWRRWSQLYSCSPNFWDNQKSFRKQIAMQ